MFPLHPVFFFSIFHFAVLLERVDVPPRLDLED